MTLHDAGRSVGRGAWPTLRKLSFVVFNPDRTPPRAALDGSEARVGRERNRRAFSPIMALAQRAA
jgi:hypothetical protein